MKVKDFFQITRFYDDTEKKMRPLDYYDFDIISANGLNFYGYEEAMEMKIDHIDIKGSHGWDGEYQTPYIEIYVK